MKGLHRFISRGQNLFALAIVISYIFVAIAAPQLAPEENAKQLAYGNLFPEMNHNELVGWNMLRDLLSKTFVVFLRDKGEHRRVSVREEITKRIVSEYASGITEVHSDGKSLLARMFSLIQFGDWVSFYLAILNNQDPTPVKAIDYLKTQLAGVK